MDRHQHHGRANVGSSYARVLQPNVNPSSLDEMRLLEDRLTLLKSGVQKVLDGLHHDSSLITRMALVWGKLPLLAKILLGVLLFGGAIAAGVFFHITILIIAGAVAAGVGVLISLLLDNHYAANQNTRKQLQVSVGGLSDALIATIGSLEQIRIKMGVEVDRFRTENDKLAGLNQQLEARHQEAQEQIQMYGDQHVRIQADYRAILERFESVSQELQQSRQNVTLLRQEFEQQKNTYTAVIQKLISLQSVEQSQRECFMEKLNAFLEDPDGILAAIDERIRNYETALQAAKSQLDEQARRNEVIIEKLTTQVNRLAHILKLRLYSAPPVDNNKSNAHLRRAHSIASFPISG